MLKKEFLDSLSDKLSLINDKEREDILLEYGTYIDDKIASGVDEQEAVAGFGDIDQLAKEILEAYKINTDTMDPLSTKADKTMDKIYEKAENILSKLGHFSMNDIFHILFDSIVLILILLIGKVILVDIMCNMVLSLLFTLFTGFYGITNFLLSLCKILYLCLCIYFFITIMTKRINRYSLKTNQQGVMEDIKDSWNENLKGSSLPPIPLYHERKTKQVNTNSTILKIILTIAMIPVILILIGSGIGFVVLIYVTISFNTTSIGLYMMDIGFILGSLMILLMLVKAWPKVKVNVHA